jgi:hypothetical protein
MVVLPGLTWRWSTKLRSTRRSTRKEDPKGCTSLGSVAGASQRCLEKTQRARKKSVASLLISRRDCVAVAEGG